MANVDKLVVQFEKSIVSEFEYVVRVVLLLNQVIEVYPSVILPTRPVQFTVLTNLSWIQKYL
jgi:hypothetical protein